MKKIIIILIVLFSIGYLAMAEGDSVMRLNSPEFKNNEYIPRKFTCLGENTSPTLIIEGIPLEAKTLALIVDDPDAPAGT